MTKGKGKSGTSPTLTTRSSPTSSHALNILIGSTASFSPSMTTVRARALAEDLARRLAAGYTPANKGVDTRAL